MPALRTICGGGEKAFFGAGGGKRNDSRDTEFSAFLDGPFEGVKLDDGEKKSDLNDGLGSGELFDQRKFYAVARDGIDAGEPGGFAIAQFVELTGLRAENVAEMMSGVALDHRGRAGIKFIDEESAAHARILSH